MAKTVLALQNMVKRYGATLGVGPIDFAVEEGEFLTLLGPSGCGKTTTLRMLAGFYEPDAGDIFIGDRRVNDIPVHRRKTAMVFQDYALFPHMSVAENVSYGLRLARVGRESAAKRMADTLQFLGLTGLEQRFPSQLSGGQQQRVALARALVMNPEVLLLDEPLSNLDAKLRVSIRTELISIQRQLGLTTIYVTHDQDEALAMSDWIAVMNRGHVIQWGTPWEVYYQPRTPFMADFLGSVNLVRAPVVASRAGSAVVQLGPHTLELPFGGELASGQALLSIRPETLALGEPSGEECLTLPGEVVRRTFLGHLMRYTVRVLLPQPQDWLVDQPDPGGSSLADGRVSIVVNPRRVHVIPEPAA